MAVVRARFKTIYGITLPFCLLAVGLVLPTATADARPVPLEEARFLMLGGIQQWMDANMPLTKN